MNDTQNKKDQDPEKSLESYIFEIQYSRMSRNQTPTNPT